MQSIYVGEKSKYNKIPKKCSTVWTELYESETKIIFFHAFILEQNITLFILKEILVPGYIAISYNKQILLMYLFISVYCLHLRGTETVGLTANCVKS